MRVAIIVATLASFATAQDHSRPDPVGTSTKVSIGIFVIDLAEIDGAAQEVVMDFVVRATWKDPRLKTPGRVDASKVWTPRLSIVNERRVFRKRKEVVEIGADGIVTYQQRYWGTLSAPIQLHEFPLDTQRVGIQLVTTPDVVFVPDKRLIGRSDEFSISDWAVGEGEVRLKIFDFVEGASGYKGLVYEFEAKRYLGFFIWKIMLPLVLIVMMSWAVFWIDPVAHGPQLAITITSMLTLMAYLVTMGQFLPSLPYLTRLDMFITGSTVLVFLALVEEVATTRMVRKKYPNLARQVDRICRWAFPGVFLAIGVFSFAL